MSKCLHPEEGYCENCTVDARQIDAAIDQLVESAWAKKSVTPFPRWIRVEDRLPDVNGFYLVYIPLGEKLPIYQDYFYTEFDGYNERGWQDEVSSQRVTHWMPLPAAPHNEEER